MTSVRWQAAKEFGVIGERRTSGVHWPAPPPLAVSMSMSPRSWAWLWLFPVVAAHAGQVGTDAERAGLRIESGVRADRLGHVVG
ncbi:hypothetical protein [Micromonospora sp. WMMD1219]|uniref:hypothetical protein n=1 Tax=Micromonospora sp. WMMD1219 TaxID=3404115 RepID=UPI003BF5832F